jgi:nitronate monooxygenase
MKNEKHLFTDYHRYSGAKVHTDFIKKPLPKIIQGGMGVGVSNWRLAQAVSRTGQLGVVSGTALDQVLARRLQQGDPAGDIRRALAHFPCRKTARRVLEAFFVPNGKTAGKPYRVSPMLEMDSGRLPLELCITANFAEVFLARENHENPVGINYLEKIQLPHLAALYGAILAGVSVVIMGAGIPLGIPSVLEALSRNQTAGYSIDLRDDDGAVRSVQQVFDPAEFFKNPPLPPAGRPDFLPIVSSETLASILLRKAPGLIDGFIVEGSTAGGHNAPPRGRTVLNRNGEPVYGKRDRPDLSAFRKTGLPFWLAGSAGSAQALRQAEAEGAVGIQAGTAFALCTESGLLPEIRRTLIQTALEGNDRIKTDPLASPTGFPFKVADLENSLSDDAVYQNRKRICDIGILRQIYLRADGVIGYRCPAEPVAAYIAKGGQEKDTLGRKCLCNALSANIGIAQTLPDGHSEPALITMGDDLKNISQFCTTEHPDYSAADVIRILLAG